MFETFFMPLGKHGDDGFGAVGRSFQDAANQLSENGCEGGARWAHGHLPINYLYRHAIELFLKSMIVVVHRRLRIPSVDGTYDPIPKIQVGVKRKSIYNVHGLRDLFDEMIRLFSSHREVISKIANTDWSAIPPDLEKWIISIEQIDPASTAFRYPLSNSPAVDEQKSSFKAIDPDELAAKMNADGPKQFALLMVDDDDNIVESFALDDNPLPELRPALVRAAETLSGASFGVLAELGGS